MVRNIRDSVPKVIGHFLVRAVQNKMQIELFKRLGKMFDAVNRAMGEPPGIVQERKALNSQLETLRKAERVLTRDPEITNLIGTSDDDLLIELKQEKAEEASGKGPKREDIMDKYLKPMMAEEKSSPVAANAPVPAPHSAPHSATPPLASVVLSQGKVTPPPTTPPTASTVQLPPKTSDPKNGDSKANASKGSKPNLFGK